MYVSPLSFLMFWICPWDLIFVSIFLFLQVLAAEYPQRWSSVQLTQESLHHRSFWLMLFMVIPPKASYEVVIGSMVIHCRIDFLTGRSECLLQQAWRLPVIYLANGSAEQETNQKALESPDLFILCRVGFNLVAWFPGMPRFSNVACSLAGAQGTRGVCYLTE